MRAVPKLVRPGILVLLCVAVPVSGCHSRHVLAPDVVTKLDEFQAGDEVPLTPQVTFTQRTPLAFVVEGVEGQDHKYAKIEIDGSVFNGWKVDWVAVGRKDSDILWEMRTGELVRVDLSMVDKIVVYVPHPGKTIGIVAAAVGGAVVVTALFVVALGVVILVSVILSGDW